MDTLAGLKRTHRCAQITEAEIGQQVTVMGWAGKVRDIGSLVFIDLRDISGIVQLVAETPAEILEKAKTVHLEYVIAAVGTVRARTGAVNDKLKTGKIEIEVTELRILNKSEALPVQIEDDTNVKDEIRLKYRYLDLRRPELQKCMVTRHRITKIARDYYDQNGFTEIETPVLTKSTPEGARDYLVPSRVHPGSYYALPQSPQLYKQLLMIAGYDRYMQIVKCFRDEDLRADRQPEFTQIDLEMSFVEVDDVIAMNEGFIKKVFKEVLDVDVKTPFQRMPYKEAMERFGSDKPDTRFGMELVDLSDALRGSEFKVFSSSLESGGSVRAINAKGLGEKFSRKELDALGEFVKTYRAKGLAWIIKTADGIKSSVAKFLSEKELSDIFALTGAEEGDGIFIVSDKNEIVFDALGALRLHIAKKFDMLDKNQYNLLWVTQFPLFEYSEEEDRYVAKHHPFTSPMDEDIDLLETHPEQARAKAYDIVLNGVELGGGSIRIFDRDLQQRMFNALGFTTEQAWDRFGFLMEAFKYGAPPHGGMAYGLDRLVMLLLGKDSIRDVIAFPKVQNASELMSGAPDVVDAKQLDELCIRNIVKEGE
ncbi:MAG: aspartate--tRNA ligase [Clostridia bacterium]|nr:aspartate--tRNA ligase [Clostridia bacterium]MBR3576511.1 aspartate--tRNA ligase [Clostridia bacterium]